MAAPNRHSSGGRLTMTLRDELEASGTWLFRRRSFVPLVFLVPLLVEMRNYHRPMHCQSLQVTWEFCCLAVSLVGLAARIITVGQRPAGTSGRNTDRQIADDLNTTGMYSIVRHPLYLGNFLMWLGIAISCLDWRLLLIFLLGFWLYYERIMLAEEKFLREKFGRQFDEWAAVTPAFIPRLSRWKRSSLPFSLRTVLRQEYTTFFLLPTAFVALEFVEHWVVERQFAVEPHWAALGIVGAIAYCALRAIKKTTHILDVAGR